MSLWRRPPAGDAPAGPASYADWSGWFDAWARGDDDDRLIECACAGKLHWSAGSAERIGVRAADALGLRLDAVQATMQAALKRGRGEQDMVRAVLDARRCLALLGRYAALPCWPEPLARQLHALIDDTAAQWQHNLLRSAQSDRSGRLASSLRRTPLDQYDRAGATVVAVPPPAAAPTRRILL